MDGLDLITQYFPGLTDRQRSQFEAMGALYASWNQRINVISRQDIDNVYEHHILHSLAIARVLQPVEGTTFMDLGTGGGFPAIPLAVLWPQCTFHLIDRIAKKLRVAADVASELGLTNITVQHGDAGECHHTFDYVLSRAVMPLDALINACRRNIAPTGANTLANGLLCLKGGDLTAEIQAVRRPVVTYPIAQYYPQLPWYADKYVVYVAMQGR